MVSLPGEGLTSVRECSAESHEAGTEEQKLRRKMESSWFNHIGDTAIVGRLDRDLQYSTWEGRY